jgi:hypothetical protein
MYGCRDTNPGDHQHPHQLSSHLQLLDGIRSIRIPAPPSTSPTPWRKP